MNTNDFNKIVLSSTFAHMEKLITKILGIGINKKLEYFNILYFRPAPIKNTKIKISGWGILALFYNYDLKYTQRIPILYMTGSTANRAHR